MSSINCGYGLSLVLIFSAWAISNSQLSQPNHVVEDSDQIGIRTEHYSVNIGKKGFRIEFLKSDGYGQ